MCVLCEREEEERGEMGRRGEVERVGTYVYMKIMAQVYRYSQIDDEVERN